MTRAYYQIQQHSGYQYEPLQEGPEYETLAEARADMADLESALGWRDMRIAEYVETESSHRMVAVVEYGTESDDDESEGNE